MPLNLVQHRSDTNVWDAAQPYDLERWMAATLAFGLVLGGFRRRSTAGLLMAAAGGALGWWAATGMEVRKHRRGRLLGVWPTQWSKHDSAVAEASEESFPASDPPAWTPTTGRA